MKEHHIEVTRTARYYTLGGPGDSEAAGPSAAPWSPEDVWFVLHGYRQLADRFLRRFRHLDDGSRLLVAPEALSRFYVESEPGRHGPRSLVGGTWMTRSDREVEIRDYVGYLDRLAARVLGPAVGEGPRTGRREPGPGGTPSEERSEGPGGPRVTVLGFSQGLHTAARWAVLGEVPLDRLVLWGDYLPPDLDMERAAERLDGVDVVFVVGESDPTRREELAEAHERRLEASGIESRTLTHPGGHELDAVLLSRLAEG